MKRIYDIELNDSLTWHLVSTEDTHSWLEEFASIIDVKPSEVIKHKSIFFLKENTIKDGNIEISNLKNIPAGGWDVFYKSPCIKLWRHENVKDVLCELNMKDKDPALGYIQMQQSLFPIYQETVKEGGAVFHAGLVELNGKGVLLSASGSVGKSTCCRRIGSPWKSLCDDASLLRYENDRYFVHPFPTWSDYFKGISKPVWNIKHSLPFSALFFLAHSEKDEVIPVQQGEAAVIAYKMSSQILGLKHLTSEKEILSLKRKIFTNACEIVKKVPSFVLKVSFEGEFWKKMEEVIY